MTSIQNLKGNKEFLSLFDNLSIEFANFLFEKDDSENDVLWLTSFLLSLLRNKGDNCIHLANYSEKSLSSIIDDLPEDFDFIMPSENTWLKHLEKSSLIGTPSDFLPIIIDSGKVYLQRYFVYETTLVDNLLKMANEKEQLTTDTELIKSIVSKYFDTNDSDGINWQLVAALSSIRNRLCVISGGPGTGKTTTVVKVLALLIELGQSKGLNPKIAICAPTGKAAARLKESISLRIDSFNNETLVNAIPKEAMTLHRLLGLGYLSAKPKYNRMNRLPYDIIVVDESSMADLEMMFFLMNAVKDDARIILLGDKDQLSSVEVGAVLGDICSVMNRNHYSSEQASFLNNIIGQAIPVEEDPKGISDNITFLTKSFRFGENSGIGKVSSLIRDGNSKRVIEILESNTFEDIDFIDIQSDFEEQFIELVTKGFLTGIEKSDPKGKLKSISDFRVLCATRKGMYGVESINRKIESLLHSKGLVFPDYTFYENLPLMITQNDYNLKLFNGDIGLILRDEETSSYKFFIEDLEDSNTLRKLVPQILPDFEKVFALTVHKSQGSEFDEILLVLPNKINSVLSRELLYTAITRAKSKVIIIGSKSIIKHMIENPVVRNSGLRERIYS